MVKYPSCKELLKNYVVRFCHADVWKIVRTAEQLFFIFQATFDIISCPYIFLSRTFIFLRSKNQQKYRFYNKSTKTGKNEQK